MAESAASSTGSPPASSPAPAAPGGPVQVVSSRQMQANGSYVVTSNAQDTIVLTLPADSQLNVGDRLRVTGQGSAVWQLAQNDGQAIVTTDLPGNVAPGTVWTPTATAQNWFATAMSASGNEIAACAWRPSTMAPTST